MDDLPPSSLPTPFPANPGHQRHLGVRQRIANPVSGPIGTLVPPWIVHGWRIMILTTTHSSEVY